jgi:hypothetical protein
MSYLSTGTSRRLSRIFQNINIDLGIARYKELNEFRTRKSAMVEIEMALNEADRKGRNKARLR